MQRAVSASGWFKETRKEVRIRKHLQCWRADILRASCVHAMQQIPVPLAGARSARITLK